MVTAGHSHFLFACFKTTSSKYKYILEQRETGNNRHDMAANNIIERIDQKNSFFIFMIIILSSYGEPVRRFVTFSLFRLSLFLFLLSTMGTNQIKVVDSKRVGKAQAKEKIPEAGLEPATLT